MYKDRVEAGKKLAQKLINFKNDDIVILALPRGGVVLGAEVAKVLHASLHLVLVRKIGHPTYSEYAIGAVAEGESPIYDKNEFETIDKKWLKDAEKSANELIKYRHELYYGSDIKQPEIKGKTVILVDDGIATGFTMKAAVLSVRNKHPERIIVAVPVAPLDITNNLKKIADEVIVLNSEPNFLGAVGAYYEKFNQVDDSEVKTILQNFNNKVPI